MTGLVVEDVHKSYTAGGVVPVLRGVSLTADAGDVVCVTGRSGSGKSTLLNILGVLSTPDSGSYRLGDTDVTRATASGRTALRATAVSTIFQQGNLFPHLTALENVVVGLDPSAGEQAARNALADTGLADLADRPAGLLSGGEQQRVSVARAMARRSTLVLADEPTASLDADNAAAVLDLLVQAARRGAVVVIASHDERVGRVASRRLALQDGVLQ